MPRSRRRSRRRHNSAKRRACRNATTSSETWVDSGPISSIPPPLAPTLSPPQAARGSGVRATREASINPLAPRNGERARSRVRKLRWMHQPCDEEDARRLAEAAKLPPIIARLMCLRGLGDPEDAARFLAPSLDHLHDPWRLTDLGTAVDRLLAAIERKERIAVHGDYDVDGVTSTVMLRRMLELVGAD